MYEPYGEKKKKIKLDFSQIKEKVKSKLSDLNLGDLNRYTYVIVALLLLLGIGGITGWVSYTGKVAEMEKQYMIMEKQIQTLENDLQTANVDIESCNLDLQSANDELSNKKQELSASVLQLEETKNTLEDCNIENNDLSDEIMELNEDIENMNDEFSDLSDDYDELENDFEDLACNVAKLSSCDYYRIEDGNRITCCFEFEGQYICAGKVESQGIIKVDC
jgi:methyl-accepting chemotaxis protein